MFGLVIKNTGSWYEIKTEEGKIVPCKIKGNFRLKGIRSTSPVAVGDRVQVELNTDGVVYIYEIEDRKNYIIRKATNLSKQSHILAANIDVAILIITLKQPETSLVFVDRFLATAEAYRIPVIILINKVDLLDETEKQKAKNIVNLYEKIGYKSIIGSVEEKIGIDKLIDLIKDKIVLVAGNSGVGKSALVNYLVPNANTKISPISDVHNTGMHTTTFSEMFFMPCGGAVIDIPGVKGFGTFNFEEYEISHFFREIFKIGTSCKYSDCKHINEPGCEVLKAVAEGRINDSRYHSYLNMLEDINEGKYREGEK
ncbi:MAG: ribosome small subunit-dependent GTPase A [Prevotellaceae bacterium]|nr:ribosome small subunit-dependent GTPase A [Candidatus Faecinaster equi]